MPPLTLEPLFPGLFLVHFLVLMEYTFQKLPNKGCIGGRFICELVTFDDIFSYSSWVVWLGIEIVVEIIFPPQRYFSIVYLLLVLLLIGVETFCS